MTVVLLGRDLIIASRVFEAGVRAGTAVTRVDDPGAGWKGKGIWTTVSLADPLS